IGCTQLFGEMLEHDRCDRATTRRRRDEHAVNVRVVFAHAQRAAELRYLDWTARVPRDAGRADAERREQRLVTAAPEPARGFLVEMQLIHEAGAARFVELVVGRFAELGDLETGRRLDAARPQLATIETVAIVLRDARRRVANLRPRGACLCGGDRRRLAGAAR